MRLAFPVFTAGVDEARGATTVADFDGGTSPMMRLPVTVAALAFGCGMVLFPACATRAQDMINNLPDYTSAWYLGDIMQRRGRDDDDTPDKPAREEAKKVERQQATSTRPPAPDAATILRQASYVPSADVEAKLDAAFAGFLAGERPDASSPGLLRALAQDNTAGSPFLHQLGKGLGGGGDDALLAALRRGELQQDYAQWLSSMGYSDTNLFDVHAAFLMHTWAIANNGVMTRDSKSAFGAVREELVNLQARPDAPRSLSRSNDRKQEEAQSFALVTALLVSAWQSADAREKTVLRDGVRALGRRIGIDYAAVTLTADGFESR